MKNSNKENIHIPDPRLALLIRPILADSPTRVEKLNAAYFRISDLSGIEHLTELKMLHLYNNDEIEDIRPLANLKKLKHLNLRYNKIKDITPLAGLTQLQTLFLDFNQISDIKPLAKLKLRELRIADNNIRDVSILENLPDLTSLTIKGNPIQDMTPIHKLCQQNPHFRLDIDFQD